MSYRMSVIEAFLVQFGGLYKDSGVAAFGQSLAVALRVNE